jgi:acyl dehydratase
MTLGRVLAFSGGPLSKSGWPDKNLHTDLAAAQRAGLSTIVASGTQWEGHIVGLLIDTVGMSWFQGGTIDIKIPRSVRVDEVLLPRIRLERLEDRIEGGQTAHFSVSVTNGDGEAVLIGTASAPVEPSAS